MKAAITRHSVAVVAVILAWFFGHMTQTKVVYAQSPVYGAVGSYPIAPSVTNCSLSQAGGWFICMVGSGSTFTPYYSANGGAYQPLASVPAGVVTSVQGHLGPTVVLTKADILALGIAAATTVSSTASTTLQ